MACVARRKENPVEDLFGNHGALVPANHLCRTVTPIFSLFVCPVPLRIVVPHPFSVNLLHFLPTPSLMEVKISHPSDDIEHCFYIILPRLFWINAQLFNAKCLIHLHSLIAVENSSSITDDRL